MLILLTNDDGIHAPGLAALKEKLDPLGEVYVVAPATEQSGVGHSITYLTPLIVKEVFHREKQWGWAVEGSPADCVKLGVSQFCPRRPDLIVSGINNGLNAGINVLYSGTVAAAIEGAFFGITSVAVSLEFDERAPFRRAAQLARVVIEQILEKKDSKPHLYNLNLPLAALDRSPEVCVVPMATSHYGEEFEKRTDPWGRNYYWATGLPPAKPAEHETDLSALAKGKVTLTPLDYDLTKKPHLTEMESWSFSLDAYNANDLAETNQHDSPTPQSGRKERRLIIE